MDIRRALHAMGHNTPHEIIVNRVPVLLARMHKRAWDAWRVETRDPTWEQLVAIEERLQLQDDKATVKRFLRTRFEAASYEACGVEDMEEEWRKWRAGRITEAQETECRRLDGRYRDYCGRIDAAETEPELRRLRQWVEDGTWSGPILARAVGVTWRVTAPQPTRNVGVVVDAGAVTWRFSVPAIKLPPVPPPTPPTPPIPPVPPGGPPGTPDKPPLSD